MNDKTKKITVIVVACVAVWFVLSITLGLLFGDKEGQQPIKEDEGQAITEDLSIYIGEYGQRAEDDGELDAPGFALLTLAEDKTCSWRAVSAKDKTCTWDKVEDGFKVILDGNEEHLFKAIEKDAIKTYIDEHGVYYGKR